MIATIRIPMKIGDSRDFAEIDFDTETYKFTAIIIHGEDYCYTQYENVMIRLLGGREKILSKYLANAVDEALEERAEKRGAG